MNNFKQSKIKEVHNVGEPYGQYQTIYHKLLMENGDKIDIGKKSVQQVGWNLEYKITEDSHEYMKAKALNKEEREQLNASAPAQTPGDPQQRAPFTQDPDKARSIEMQTCLKEANLYHATHGFIADDHAQRLVELTTTAKTFYDLTFKV